MVIPGNIHTSNTIWTQLYSGIHVYKHTYMRTITISGKKETMNLKESREGRGIWEGFGGRKGKGKM